MDDAFDATLRDRWIELVEAQLAEQEDETAGPRSDQPATPEALQLQEALERYRAHHRAYQRAYYQRPEVKERRRRIRQQARKERVRGNTTTLSTKGQLTIPARIRRQLGVKAGDRFDIFSTGHTSFVATRRRPSRILKFVGALAQVDGEVRGR